VKKTIAKEKAKSAFSGSLTLDSRGASINPGQFLFSQQADQGACAFVLLFFALIASGIP
jgi:hypothetical protein